MGIERSENVGVAFALVIGAGAATSLGAGVVFFPSLVRLASRKTLAAALGLSAGVMTYVSFVEIIAKATEAFEEAGFSEDQSNLYMTLTFFAGVFFMITLNFVVTKLLGGHHHHDHHATENGKSTAEDSAPDGIELEDEGNIGEDPALVCCGHDDDPVQTLSQVQHMAEEMEHSQVHGSSTGSPEVVGNEQVGSDEIDGNLRNSTGDKKKDATKQKLMAMSLNTALAIGLHNFPEGLATFVAALSDPAVGAVLAVAIAIHNIPEGLCVAMPIYYATGNRWKAFGWAMLSGVAEPLAGLLGWLILASSFSSQLYGVLFGMVGGMMVIISVRELLPTAHRYDPDDTVVTFSFIAGMGIMALSLMLFLI